MRLLRSAVGVGLNTTNRPLYSREKRRAQRLAFRVGSVWPAARYSIVCCGVLSRLDICASWHASQSETHRQLSLLSVERLRPPLQTVGDPLDGDHLVGGHREVGDGLQTRCPAGCWEKRDPLPHARKSMTIERLRTMWIVLGSHAFAEGSS